MAGGRIDLERKQAIILEARAARRNGLTESANPYLEECEEHAVWQEFYRMTITDELRNELIDAEYEVSAY